MRTCRNIRPCRQIHRHRWTAALAILAMLFTALPVVAGALADPTVSPQLTQVNVAGSFESKIGGSSAEVSAALQWSLGGLLIQSPREITHTIKAGQPTENIYGRIFVKEQTQKPGPISGMILEVGYGKPGTRPPAWGTWQPMTFSKDYPAGDPNEGWEEWTGVVYPDMVGEFGYLMRVSPDGGWTWYYTGLRVGTENPGLLHVVPSSDTTAPAAPANARITGTTPESITITWNANTEADLWAYEVYRQVPGGAWVRAGTARAPATTFTDREVSSGATYRYYVLAVDTSYNRSPQSNQVEAKAEARRVKVTFKVIVPPYTSPLDTVFLPGNQPPLGPWNPSLWKMTTTGPDTWTTTFELLDGTALEYKYTRGSWDTVEWWGTIVETNNRKLMVTYGTDGAQTVNDTVELWRDPLVVHTDPAMIDRNVPVDKAIKVVFSRPVKPETLTDRVSLTTGGAAVTGTVTFDAATRTLTFTPTAALQKDKPYTFKLSPGIVSDANAPMQRALMLMFTTGPYRVLLPILTP